MGHSSLSRKILHQLTKLPNAPGVYFFRDANNAVIYIGKAKSIRKRVSSHFRISPEPSFRSREMVEEVVKIDFITTKNEVEAFILEARLIKRQKPKYNVEWKDDKNYLYVVVEDSEKIDYPRIYTSRKPNPEAKANFGPFVEAFILRKILLFVRRLFPYRTCKVMPKKPCLFYHIKRCPAPCVGLISKKDYQKIIQKIILFLSGDYVKLTNRLTKEMKQLSQKKAFEEAAKIRDQIKALERINEVNFLQSYSFPEEGKGIKDLIGRLRKFFPDLEYHSAFRIEAYDVSNISGTAGTGSMVVFIDGQKIPTEYRRFKIKTVSEMNDVACMQEILERRLTRQKEWLLPDLIILDGGKGQLKAAQRVLQRFSLSIPYLGLAKKKELVYLPGQTEPLDLPLESPALLFLKKIRDEAHRFAKRYHLKLRSMKMRGLDKKKG